jgi:CheY-like chemotaxis protein
MTVASSSDAILRHVSESDSPRLLVLDLSAPDCDVQRIVAEARNLPSPPTVVAYASHVLGPLLQKARQSGCDLVLTRGQFVSRLDELLQAAIG